MHLSKAFIGGLLVAAALAACSSSPTSPSSSTPTSGGMTGGTTVSISDFVFSPSTISVKVGTTVTWPTMGRRRTRPRATAAFGTAGRSGRA